MTAYQSMLLSVCFAATVGMMLSGLILSIKYWIEDRREKKRRAKEEKEAAESSEN